MSMFGWMLKRIKGKAFASVGIVKCPQCGAGRDDVDKDVKTYGFGGRALSHDFTCRKCGFRWNSDIGAVS